MKKIRTLYLLTMLLALFALLPALAEDVSSATATDMAISDTVIGQAVAKAQFNMRKSASMDSDIVANIPQGSALQIMTYGDDWCYVRYNWVSGWCKRSWLRLKGSIAQQTESSEPILLATGSDLTNSVGSSVATSAIYMAKTRVKCSIRKSPEEDAYRMLEVRKGGDLYVLGYGDDWCLVRSLDGKVTGYAKTKWLFHYHSYAPFEYEVPGYDVYRMNGYITMKTAVHVADSENHYGGHDLVAGTILFAKDAPTDTATILVWKDLVDVPAASVEYTPLVPWREAKEGDIVGGYTCLYGKRQGGSYYVNRKHNIKLAMDRMNETIIKSGEEYSFLTNVGPVTTGSGYLRAGITGGIGSGTGGGICQTSTLMYEAALSLPFYITEREPHTDDGTYYVPIEFDATVGAYSDFRFVNTLPYDVKMITYLYPSSGTMTVMFQCVETIDPTILASWNGLSILSTCEYRN